MLTELEWGPVAAAWWAFVLMTGPGYLLNRRFVWNRRTRSSFTSEIVPYWTFGLCGLGLALLVAKFLSVAMPNTWLYIVGSITAYGLVHIARFMFLDTWLFGS